MSFSQAIAAVEFEGVLEEAILKYLKSVDGGQPCQQDELLAQFPGVAKELKQFFIDEEQLDRFVSPLRTPTRNLTIESQASSSGSPALPAIPGYEIMQVIGQGGMGIVYKARQIGLNRIVAVKMIRMRRPADPLMLGRFQKEGENVAQMHHPNIIGVYESGKVDGQPYFVLEFVSGGNLAERIKESLWAPKAAAELIVCLADAVQFAHRINIIHRDLKPANILITPSGVPKIGDFGLSKQLQSSAGVLTLAGDCVGTPAYMAKEVAEGRLDEIGPGTDIFGLGAVLYELLTGRPPYEGPSREQVLNQASLAKILPPRQLRPTIPVALEKICLKAMAADPRQRYASASAMAEDLRNYLRPARPITRGAVGLGLLMSAAVVAWALITPVLWPPAFNKATDEDPAKKDSKSKAESKGTKEVEPSPAGSDELAVKAHSILKKHCHRCHGEAGSIEGGLNYVLDRELLVRRGKVVPGVPSKSRLYKYIEDGKMPPDEEQPRPSHLEIAELRAWILADAPDFNPKPDARVLITTEDLLKALRTDLQEANELDRPFFRYFTITHLYNAGHPDGVLQTYRSGLSKLLNSLSWQRRIVVPAPIDPARTILRIDLRDYAWNAEAWKLLVDSYPYGMKPASDAGQFCVSTTNSPLPYLRADWFVFAAARPPLYHQILELPDNALDLEKRLGVNVLKNLANYRVARAGFNGSGISSSNRIIERHDSFFGAYWRSYDFASPDGRKNIFAHPLGTGRDESSAFNFRHDGGEILFNLPNGLQAYLLVDAANKRIDKGPINIVSDARQKKDPTVINGISCMNCHSRGIIEKEDQVRAHVQNPRAFPNRVEARTILALYKSREEFAALLKQDAEHFAASVRRTGSHLSSTEPIFALSSHYELDVDLKQAAFEAGESVEDFERALQIPKLAQIFGPLLTKGGTVHRKVFDDNFGKIITETGGIPIAPISVVDLELKKATLPSAPTGERLLTNSIGMKFKLIPSTTFHISVGEEKGKEMKVGRYWIGIHEVTQEQYKAVIGKNPSHYSVTGEGKQDVKGDTNHFPVESVSWNDAVKFCEELSKMEKGRFYRLPTEAEWEHACRAGTTTVYSFGDTPARLGEYAWFEKNSEGRPHKVGEKLPNAWGLYDMHGNVQEWCLPSDPAKDGRFQRGGSWDRLASECRSDMRRSSAAGVKGMDFGFRVVLEVSENDLRTIGKAP